MTTRIRCDVLVVGAGPAGASAAITLARLGKSVLIVDRVAFPRAKPCGDGLMPGAVSALERLGVDPSSLGGRNILGISLSMDDRGCRHHAFPEGSPPGLAIPRQVLDAALIATAVAAGAQFRSGFTARDVLWNSGRAIGVRCEEPDGGSSEFLADWTVVADGSGSRLGRLAGLRGSNRRRRGIALRAYFAGLPDLDGYFRLFLPFTRRPLGPALPTGYGWSFPLGNGMANVGVGLVSDFEPGPGTSLRSVFESFVGHLRAHGAPFDAMVQAGPVEGGVLDCGFDAQATCRDGLLLAGDAAGLVDPLTGEGIYSALESGRLCAELIDAYRLSRKDVVRGYGEVLAVRHGERHGRGRQPLANPRFVWRVLAETFGSDAPLFRELRRAVLGQDTGPVRLAVPSMSSCVAAPCGMSLREFTASVSAHVGTLIGGAFPLLPRIAEGWLREAASLERVAAAWRITRADSGRLARYVAGAACVELLAMGSRVLAGIPRGTVDALSESGVRCLSRRTWSAGPANRWPTTIALLVADFVLATSYSAGARLGPEVCERLSYAGMRLCAEGARRTERSSRGQPDRVEVVEPAAEQDSAILLELASDVARALLPPRTGEPARAFEGLPPGMVEHGPSAETGAC